MSRLPIGERIRTRRQERGMTQVGLAEAIGVSASYLNLIEHDKRDIGGALLKRIAAALNTELSWLSGSEDTQLAEDLSELARSMAFVDLNEENALRFVAQSPEWARAVRTLHRRYEQANQAASAMSDRLSQDPALVELSHSVLTQITSIRAFAEILEGYQDLTQEEQLRFSRIIAEQSDRLGSNAREMLGLLGGGPEMTPASAPINEVEDFIIYNDNYFPDLEDAAAEIAQVSGISHPVELSAIRARLESAHGIRVFQAEGPCEEPDDGLALDIWTPETSQRFSLARRLAEIELADRLEDMVQDDSLTSPQSRSIAKRALANYSAGAILFPYDVFFDSAESYRYDIDRLSILHHGSFEQIAHRLVTLRRPGREGIPFAFLRADPAGNISKPFSIPGLRMPRLGGACPLWALYGAFSRPGTPIAQLAEMPHGERYIFIACQTQKRLERIGQVKAGLSIMIGCDAAYADRIVYGDMVNAGSSTEKIPDALVTKVGFNCRSCPRTECAQRAHPAILGTAPLARDGDRRSISKAGPRPEAEELLEGEAT